VIFLTKSRLPCGVFSAGDLRNAQNGLANSIVYDYHPVRPKTNWRRKEETMFGKFVKKNMDKSPDEALDDGRKAINKGISGGLTKAFMGQDMVSKIAIPRKGDTIKIKYNPADPKQFVVMS
jgi:hypothetical protein